MKTIELDIDDSCEDCKKALEYLAVLHKKHSGCYGSWNKRTKSFIRGLILRPDYNCSGFCTHFHLEKQIVADKDGD